VFGLAIFVFSVFRVGRAGVSVGENDVTVRNWFRNRTLERKDVDHFEPGYQMDDLSIKELFSTPSLQTFVVLKNGKHLAVSGLSTTRLGTKISREKVRKLIDQLNSAIR
jgi:hypothetical protein